MKKNRSASADAAELRRLAEERLKEKTPETGRPRKEADQQRFLRELQVHQIELELQNEELRQAQEKIQTGLEEYTDLYEFAPMGYFSLDRDGAIRAANLAGAGLLGIERDRLMGKPFWRFVEPEFRPAFKACLEKVFERKAKEIREVALLKKGNQTLFVRIEATLAENAQVCRAAVMDITERKRGEEALRESEERYRELFEAESDALFLIDNATGNILEANSAAAALYGYGQDELLKKRNVDLSAEPGETQQVTQGTPIISDRVVTIPLRYHRKKDGTVFPVEITGRFLVRHGQPVHISAKRDITARKQAETELHIALGKYRVLFESFPLGISITDAAGNLIEANRESERLLGVPRDEHARRKYDSPEWRIVRPDGTPMPADEYASARALREKRLLENVEMGIVKDGGEITWINVSAAPIPLEGYGVAISYGDITARKQVDDALRVKDWAIRSAINAIAISDMEGNLNYVNPAFLKLWGYSSPAEVLGKPVGGFWQVSEKAAEVIEALSARGGWSGEMVAKSKDGSLFDVQVAASLVRDAIGRPICMLASFADISELKRVLARAQYLAHTDTLTGVNNRRYWFELAAHEFEVALRYRHPLCVMMIDIDHFKQINDTFGHAVGDQMLERVAQVARTELRSVDTIGRYGGEEFVIALPLTTAQHAYPVAERIRNGVAGIRVDTDKGQAAVTLSIGIAELLLAPPGEHPGGDESVERVIHRADQALYAAKAAGRNRTATWSAPAERRAPRKLHPN